MSAARPSKKTSSMPTGSATPPGKTLAAAKKTSTKKVADKKTASTKAATKKSSAAAGAKTVKKQPAKESTTTVKATTEPSVAPAKPTPEIKKSVETTSPKKKLPKFLTDKSWLDQQRETLIEERRKYTHNAAALAAEAHALMADRDPGDVQFDEESGEGDTLAVERDRDLALSGLALEKVSEIDAALARLDAGTYGLCIVSGEVIPKERLEALPMAAKTVAAQTAMF